MKKLAVAISILAVSAPSVLAADLPVYTKAPAVVEHVYNWTGFYVGGNAGYSWGHSNTDLVLDRPTRVGVNEIPIGSTSQNINGALGGFQAGYNKQINSIILGVEADIQITGQKGRSQLSDTVLVDNDCLAPCAPPPPTPVTGTFDYTRKLPWFGTLRGRLGVTPTDRWLIYLTGGLAFGEIRSDATFSVPSAVAACIVGVPCPAPPPTTASGSFSQTKIGWVLGAGVEAALGGNWTGKLEYLHIDFGNSGDSFASGLAFPFFGGFTANSRLTDDIVRVGLNYRLHP
jgi:outer membrane immunogenic protein